VFFIPFGSPFLILLYTFIFSFLPISLQSLIFTTFIFIYNFFKFFILFIINIHLISWKLIIVVFILLKFYIFVNLFELFTFLSTNL